MDRLATEAERVATELKRTRGEHVAITKATEDKAEAAKRAAEEAKRLAAAQALAAAHARDAAAAHAVFAASVRGIEGTTRGTIFAVERMPPALQETTAALERVAPAAGQRVRR